jgi:hypothetical protein
MVRCKKFTDPVIDYSKYIRELIDMMFPLNSQGVIFGKRAREIGEELVALGGANALFNTMNIMVAKMQEEEYSDEFLSRLRELEFCWSGISEDFQA